jgi:glucose-6-phosphate isomerase
MRRTVQFADVRHYASVRLCVALETGLGAPWSTAERGPGDRKDIVTSASLEDSSAWLALKAHHRQVAPRHLRALFAEDTRRFRRFSMETCGLLLDYSKNRITGETMDLLLALARQEELEKWRDHMFSGKAVNVSEDRAALHVALRRPGGEAFPSAGADVMVEVLAVRERMGELGDAVASGRWRGHSGEPIGAVVHLGIGGSHLGPALASAALAVEGRGGPAVRFVSNLDGADLVAGLDGLDPRSTLFIVASKSFTTPECLANAASARSWLLEGSGFPDEALAKHFLAVTGAPERAVAFGIPAENVLPMEDWVGGRYSVWSAIGLPVVLGLGMPVFDELLAGAHDMDRHFREAPLAENMPVILGLLGIWYRNFFAAATRAVLPYDYALRLLPAYLQQLEMESNGKRVGRDGESIDHNTCPVVWGAPGIDGQHAFYQLLHQGTELVPCDFIVAVSGQHPLPGHDRGVLANALAQTEALMLGRPEGLVSEELTAAGQSAEVLAAAVAHRVSAGNQPSNTLLYGRLTARRLGALIALYEHRTFVQSVIWRVNPFDQWGVELGKTLAGRLLAELDGEPGAGHDASTEGLLAHARKLEGDG